MGESERGDAGDAGMVIAGFVGRRGVFPASVHDRSGLSGILEGENCMSI